jgi:hypothetical protein
VGQSRITLNSEVQILADELCRMTGCNLASLFGLMLTRYGNHLRHTWQVTNLEQPKRIEQQSSIVNLSQQPYVEDDPVIRRIAGVIENF